MVQYKKSFLFIILFFALLSTLAGLNNLSKSGVDCQIDAASVLNNNISPYKLYLENQYYFKYSRVPTHLPQNYYILQLFLFFSEKINYLLYGITGILFLFIITSYINIKDNFYIVLLILITTPFRNNLGNGQFLFFYFSFFLLVDYLITKKIQFLFHNFITIPILLVLLLSKPTLFFWIPFYYKLTKRLFFSYFTAFFLQFLIIYLFTLQTNIHFIDFFIDYIKILGKHLNLTQSSSSVYFINITTNLMSISSFLVVINLVFSFFYIYKKNFSISKVDNFIYLFSILIISFILVYHATYDLFLLLIPFLYNGLKSFYFILITLFFIFMKLIYVFISDTNTANILTSFSVNIITLIVFIYYKYFENKLIDKKNI